MESCKKIGAYIGTTKTSAGIFLSRKIINRKKYGKYLHVERFENLEEAVETFFSRYADWVKREEFRLNKLFRIRENPRYSVFFSGEYVGLTYSENCYETAEKVLPADAAIPYWRHNLTYEEATNYVRGHFANWYRNEQLFVNTAVRLHQPIYLSELRK